MSESKSLAARQGLTGDLKLPAMFEAPVQVEPRVLCPYVCFAHPNSSQWAKFVGVKPSTVEGDQFLIEAEGVRCVTPMKYSLLTAKQYWARGDKEGPKEWSLHERAWPFGEVVESVLLLYLPERLLPVTCQFRTTKTGAVHPMVQALEKAATPAWAELSEAHKETLVCQKPFMRFYGEVRLELARTSKTGPGAGNKYTPAYVVVKPTGVTEWRALAEAFRPDNEAFYKKLDEAAAVFQRRIEEVVAKAS